MVMTRWVSRWVLQGMGPTQGGFRWGVEVACRAYLMYPDFSVTLEN